MSSSEGKEERSFSRARFNSLSEGELAGNAVRSEWGAMIFLSRREWAIVNADVLQNTSLSRLGVCPVIEDGFDDGSMGVIGAFESGGCRSGSYRGGVVLHVDSRTSSRIGCGFAVTPMRFRRGL